MTAYLASEPPAWFTTPRTVFFVGSHYSWREYMHAEIDRAVKSGVPDPLIKGQLGNGQFSIAEARYRRLVRSHDMRGYSGQVDLVWGYGSSMAAHELREVEAMVRFYNSRGGEADLTTAQPN